MRRKKDPRKYIVVILIGLLALLVGIALILEDREKPSGGRQVQKPGHGPRDTRVVRVKEYALPELMIKGCLFDLGIPERDTRITGRTIRVTGDEIPSRREISRAFRPIGEVGHFEMEGDRLARVVINSSQWEIHFSRTAAIIARCAIIIDDMGMNMDHAEELGGIDADLTFAVLPRLPDSGRVSRFLHAKGREILLHLPMQGNGKDPGPGAIYSGMPSAEIRATLKENIRSVPNISGVNNHMGSTVTADQDVMREVMGELKDREYFFVDSLTTNRSVCRAVAGDLKVPFIARDVFLDNSLSEKAISSQMEKMVRIAMSHGEAVAIGHPHPETIAVLRQVVPRLREKGIEVVRISELLPEAGDRR